MRVPELNYERTYEKLQDFVRDNIKSKRAIIGLSGGIDSSLTAYLLKNSLREGQVLGLIMPYKRTSDAVDARLVANRLGIETREISIAPIYESVLRQVPEIVTRGATANLQSRIRMQLLYSYANELDGIVVGTTNKSESMIGYYTKFGDGGVDIEPIIGLYKTQERGLARWLKMPESVINREPTAGLWEGQTDESEIGMDYETLDKLLYCFEMGTTVHNAAGLCQVGVDVSEKVFRMIKNSEHKRHVPVSGPEGVRKHL